MRIAYAPISFLDCSSFFFSHNRRLVYAGVSLNTSEEGFETDDIWISREIMYDFLHLTALVITFSMIINIFFNAITF